MAKKKDKPQVINNIQELNLEIDYDKLAEAIVRANKKAEEEKEAEYRKRKLSKSFYIIAISYLIFAIYLSGCAIFFAIQDDFYRSSSMFITAIIPILTIVMHYIIFKGGKVERIYPIVSIMFNLVMATPYAPKKFVVSDMLPEGLILLCGPSKIGKSWFVLQFCLAVALGKKFLAFRNNCINTLTALCCNRNNCVKILCRCHYFNFCNCCNANSSIIFLFCSKIFRFCSFTARKLSSIANCSLSKCSLW